MTFSGQSSLSAETPNACAFLHTDQGPDGVVHTWSAFRVTPGPGVTEWPVATQCRAFCYTIVGHLSDESLIEASESLAEIYTSQMDAMNPALVLEKPAAKSRGVATVKKRPRPSFAY